MSRPPNSTAAAAIDAATEDSSRTSQTTPRTLSPPNALPSAARVSSSAAWSRSLSTTCAPSASSRRATACPMPPAPPVMSADPAFERLGLRQPLQLGLFEQPVLDVEGLLLGDRHVLVDALGPAHDVDRVDEVFGGDARRLLVLLEGEQADARDEQQHRHRVAHRRRVRPLAALVVGGVVGRVALDQRAELRGELRRGLLPGRERHPQRQDLRAQEVIRARGALGGELRRRAPSRRTRGSPDRRRSASPSAWSRSACRGAAVRARRRTPAAPPRAAAPPPAVRTAAACRWRRAMPRRAR